MIVVTSTVLTVIYDTYCLCFSSSHIVSQLALIVNVPYLALKKVDDTSTFIFRLI